MRDSTAPLQPLHPIEVIAMAHDILNCAVTRDILASFPIDRSPEDRVDRLPRAQEDDLASIPGRTTSHTFEVLLECALDIETDLSELRYSVDNRVRYHFTTHVYNNGDIESIMGAVIEHNGNPVVIDIEDPVVFNAVLRNCDGPLRDRIRVACQVVRILRDAICLLSLPDRIRGRIGTSLRNAVRVLGELVSADRDEQSYAADNEAAPAEYRSDDRKDDLRSVHETSPSVVDAGAHSVGEGDVAGVEHTAPVTDARLLDAYLDGGAA
ncbi:hypothetical protein [Rhodococcus sp. BH5]|uniref:hypothetical protein n=1 Tax=Rhodococcus sp. BH5 TaxID=2871702 RepID=UPI0022CD2A52|nr:hypothetical protein [Rhodococcus sp. BH5]MCZ9631355.1 hypothetical protein [Rhodococcus sp. BH5]